VFGNLQEVSSTDRAGPPVSVACWYPNSARLSTPKAEAGGNVCCFQPGCLRSLAVRSATGRAAQFVPVALTAAIGVAIHRHGRHLRVATDECKLFLMRLSEASAHHAASTRALSEHVAASESVHGSAPRRARHSAKSYTVARQML